MARIHRRTIQKKIFMTQITTSQKSWSVNWALESITTNKANGGDGIPVISNSKR